jgi:hypothetical protein
MDTKIKYLFFATIILLFWGCRKESATQVETKTAKLDELFELHAGEAVLICAEPLSFRFDSLLSEGRCPSGYYCFWEGNAAIVITCTDTHDTLNTTLSPREVTKGAYTITLRTLSPYPTAGKSISKNDYVAQFIVKKN